MWTASWVLILHVILIAHLRGPRGLHLASIPAAERATDANPGVGCTAHTHGQIQASADSTAITPTRLASFTSLATCDTSTRSDFLSLGPVLPSIMSHVQILFRLRGSKLVSVSIVERAKALRSLGQFIRQQEASGSKAPPARRRLVLIP